jgi:hypothetical protein
MTRSTSAPVLQGRIAAEPAEKKAILNSALVVVIGN